MNVAASAVKSAAHLSVEPVAPWKQSTRSIAAAGASAPRGDAQLQLKELRTAVDGLPDNLRIPFDMSFTGYKYEEIAQKLQIPLGTVKIRIHIARKKLQEQLKGERA